MIAVSMPSPRTLAIGVAAALAIGAVTAQQIRIDGLTLRPHIGSFGVTLIDIKGWRPRALSAEAALADVKAAQPKAAAAQAAVNHQPAVISAAIAERSNASALDYYRRAGAAADLHRVQPSTVARGAGGSDLSGADHAAKVDDGSVAPADLVCRPRADDDLLTGAAARAAQMHADAQALIAAGVAVKSGG